jgi:hypothetical protein
VTGSLRTEWAGRNKLVTASESCRASELLNISTAQDVVEWQHKQEGAWRYCGNRDQLGEEVGGFRRSERDRVLRTVQATRDSKDSLLNQDTLQYL